MAIVKRILNGFDLVGDGLRLVLTQKKLLGMMALIWFGLLVLIGNFSFFFLRARVAGIKSSWFAQPTFLEQLKPYVMYFPVWVAVLVVLALALLVMLFSFVFSTAYSWLVRDALAKKQLHIFGRIKDSASRVLSLSWLILLFLALLILRNVSFIFLFAFPMLAEKRHDVSRLVGRSIELFLYHVPELIGAVVAFFAYILFGLILVGVPLGLLALAGAHIFGFVIYNAVAINVAITFLLVIFTVGSAYSTVPVMLYKKAK